MDLEQLRVTLDAIQAVGGDAKSVILWWLLGNFATQAIGWLILAGSLFAAYRIAMALIRSNCGAHAMADELGHQVKWGWGKCDTDDCVASIRRLQEKAKEKTNA